MTAGRKTLAGSVLALATLLLANFLAYRSTRQLIEGQLEIEHAHDVIETIEAVVSLAVDLETAARGYVITGDREYLQPWEAAREPIAEKLQTLRELTVDNPVHRHIAALESWVQAKREIVDRVVTVRTMDSPEAAADLVRRGLGKEYMDAIRSVAATMKGEERALLAQRERAASGRARRTIVVLSAGTLLSVALLATVLYLLYRELGQRKRAEAALRETDERLNLALGSAEVGTWDWNMVDDVITWDDYLHPLFGLAPRTFPGRYEDFAALVRPDDRERVAQEVARAVEGNAPFDSEYGVVWPDGSVHLIGARGKVYRDEGGRAVRMAGVCWDVTERRRAEAALRERTLDLEAANEALGSFTYSVSHDLRAPLRAIDGYARILTEDHAERLDGEGRRLLGVVCDNARQMGRLIDDLLTFSRLGRKELETGRVDIAALARSVVDELQRHEPDRRLTVTIGSLAPALADAGMVRHVLTNLIGNAWKFTRRRDDATIEVGCIRGAGETTYFVKDNGAGFDMQYAAKLFGVFQRLHHAEEFEGTGVGLAIVQRIVQRHGGRVCAEGAVDRGAAFYFTLPAEGGQHGSEGRGDTPGRGQSGGRGARDAGATEAEPGQRAAPRA